MRYFYSSFIITVLALGLAWYVGGLAGAYVAVLLMVLEISLSLDNAVVNAKVLQGMSPQWRNRFIVLGIPIAVFGMRLVFPLVIVALATGLGMVSTFEMALHQPHQYEMVLKATEKMIFAFGGAFLLMVFLDFFFEKRDVKWFSFVEGSKIVEKISMVNNIELVIAIIFGLVLAQLTHELDVVLSFMYGVLLHAILGSVDHLFATDTQRSGLMGFIYLEVLDASFSFDGVIGAFAMSSNIFIIMIGLGVGAMFVRSITLYFVEHQTLSRFQYLEHGAHYAIGILAIIMLIKIMTPVDEIITGTIGVGFIALSLVHSMWENKRNAA